MVNDGSTGPVGRERSSELAAREIPLHHTSECQVLLCYAHLMSGAYDSTQSRLQDTYTLGVLALHTSRSERKIGKSRIPIIASTTIVTRQQLAQDLPE